MFETVGVDIYPRKMSNRCFGMVFIEKVAFEMICLRKLEKGIVSRGGIILFPQQSTQNLLIPLINVL